VSEPEYLDKAISFPIISRQLHIGILAAIC
jgi:hypothetical protein